MMIEYLPWSSQVLESAITAYKSGRFSILDLDMGGGCNLNCIYCDSPDRKVSANWDLSTVQHIITNKAIDWLFICGLGEPLHHSNRGRFQELITCCQANGVRCSIFTNGLEIDEWFCQMVQEGVLSVLLKLDSFNSLVADRIYGKKISHKMIANMEKLAKSAVISDNCSNIAASIVPSIFNINEVPELVRFCAQHGFFPLIGELEDSGHAQGRITEIGVDRQQLVTMKEKVSNVLGEQYSIPTCPAILAGIHIDHNGAIIVDQFTGLSCHWFWLQKPKVYQIGHIDEKRSLHEYWKRIVTYRSLRLTDVERSIANIDEYPLGGCGGNVRQLLESYIMTQKVISYSE